MNGISEDAHDLVDHSFAWQVQFENPSDPDFLPLLSGWLKNIPGVDSSNANEGVFEIKIKCPLKILLRILYVFFIAADSNSHLATTLESRALLLEKGKEWLDFHPDKTNIANYFLRSKNRDEEQAVVIENIFKIQNTAEWLIQENQSIHRYHFHQNKNNSNSTPEVLPYKKIFQQKNQVNLFLWNNDIESYTHLLFIVKEEGTSKLLNILSRYEWWIKKDWKHIYVLHKKGNIHWQLPALKKWTTSMVFEDDHYKAYLLKYQKDVA